MSWRLECFEMKYSQVVRDPSFDGSRPARTVSKLLGGELLTWILVVMDNRGETKANPFH